MHPTLTPLADDVDFRKLAETYEVSGGDIRNAVLKGALSAATTPQHDTLKLIHHHHLDEGIREVIAGRKVMKQSSVSRHARLPIATRLEPNASCAVSVSALFIALVALLAAIFR